MRADISASPFYPSLHSFDSGNGVSILTAALGFGEQPQGVIGGLAHKGVSRRVSAVIRKSFLRVFDRVAFLAEKMLYHPAHLHVLGAVLACSPRRPERVKLLEGVFPEAQGRYGNIEHRRHLADFVEGFGVIFLHRLEVRLTTILPLL